MSESISIKVTIAGRKYPLSVSTKDEALIQEIAKDLDKTVETLQSSYSVNDKQDLMAMAALQVATKQAINQNNSASNSESNSEIIDDLKALLERSNHLT